MTSFLYIGAGGALGACLRHGMTLWFGNATWATLSVNVLGSFVLGGITAWALARNWPGEAALWLFFATGLLGAFTTFSAFSRETTHFLLDGQVIRGLGYMAANLCGAVGAFAVALLLVRRLLA